MVDLPWLHDYPAGIDWYTEIPEKPVYKIFDEAVEEFGDHYAFNFLGKRYRYDEMAVLIKKLAVAFQKKGIGKGDKVGLFLPNSPYYYVAYYAILKTGATVVNFNPLYAKSELEYQINDSDTKMMITLDLSMLYDKVLACLATTSLDHVLVCKMADILPFPKNLLFPFVKKKELANLKRDDKHAFWDEFLDSAGDDTLKAVEIDPKEDIAVIQYTGGTTGVPKGAMLTHYNIYANTLQSKAWFKSVRLGEEKMLGVLPFFHVFAMIVVLNLGVHSGMEIIAVPRFDLDDVLDVVTKKKPTLFPAVPAIYTSIVHHKNIGKYDLSSIRYCISGGAPLPVEIKKSFEEITGCQLAEGYGLTESSPVAVCNPLEGINKAGSIGLPLPQTYIDIISPETGKEVAQGEPGEICIRGPQVMKGYYKRPEETDKVLKEGVLRTGDIGYMDEQGYIFIIDRIKDLIITNGYNVYPRQVEEAIYKHEAVEECIVAGLPDDKRGEIVKAWIKIKEGKTLTEDEIKTFLKDHISAYEMPRKIEFRREPLPKTMIGKLSRKDIVAQELEA